MLPAMADLVIRDWAARLLGHRPADLELAGIDHRDTGFTARFTVAGEADQVLVACDQVSDGSWKVHATLGNEHRTTLAKTVAYGDIVVAPPR
jgi:hypothetical protein